MSQEVMEMLRRLVDAINAGEVPRDLIASDFELTNATTAVTDASYFGREGVLEWRRDLFDVIDDARFVVDEVLTTGPDHVVIVNRLVGHGSSSGAPLELRWASAIWFRDGRLTRAAGYPSRREALEAVGLREPADS